MDLLGLITGILGQLGVAVSEKISDWIEASKTSSGELNISALAELVGSYITGQTNLELSEATKLVSTLLGHYEIVSNPQRLYAEIAVLLAEISAGKSPSILGGEVA